MRTTNNIDINSLPGEAVFQMKQKLKNAFAQSSGRGNRSLRIIVGLDAVDPLRWLAAQEMRQRFYWQCRSGLTKVAGIGTAKKFAGVGASELKQLKKMIRWLKNTSHVPFKFYGGTRFDLNSPGSGEWEAFGNFCFILPRFELIEEKEKCSFACNITEEEIAASPEIVEKISEELDRLVFGYNAFAANGFDLIERVDKPDKERWSGGVNRAFGLFDAGILQKIVLARQTSFLTEGAFHPLLALDKLRNDGEQCYVFAFSPDGNETFIGASPERLYKKKHNDFYTEILAGTAQRSQNPAEDGRIAEELFASDKDLAEHRYVMKGVAEACSHLCGDFRFTDDLSVKSFAYHHHLFCEGTGVLNPHIDDVDILNSLHPTPAVGGYPQKEALDSISRIEGFDRGWYAGPIGWIAHNTSEFAVAIRSGLLAGDRLYAYSGAGIVKDSIPEKEWDEIEGKMIGFTQLFNSYVK